ncbi:Chlorovirus glycoprotein repeat domain-containing protein [Paramecium bursaria Chlorella virus Can18-4]|nr:Chlorovirus glycoprotein repeat domain-containing protein [Paramecium bursaria Chlorella virus Can18-4]
MSYNNFKYNMQKYAFINPVTRNLVVPGNLYVDGSANIPGLQPADIAPISSTDIIGNILSGVYVSVSGNVKAQNLIGNGTFLENLTVEVPGNISADVLGNISGPKITLTGNVVAATLVGNASRLAGVIVGFPSTGIADIRGNVFAPGNVNAANVSANSLVVYGNTFANSVVATGNVIANYFSGNGFFLTDVTQTFPSAADIDIVGNVSAPGDVDTSLLTAGNIIAGNAIANSMVITGNIYASYFSGNASNVTGVIPSTLDTEIFGNVFASGNVSASYLIGNGTAVTLDGYTIVPRGTVANQTARLALPDALPGSIVFQTDANVTYMLLGTPASLVSNWLQFTGANFPVTSVMGRTGNVLLLSNVDVKTIGGANIAAPGSLTSANIDIVGNVTGQFVAANVIVSSEIATNVLRANTMTIAGNVIANYLVGNGMLLEAVQLTIPRTANIDITGNVLAPANVDTQSIITTIVRAGNVSVNGQVNIVGNVSAAFFVGNGSTMIGIPPSGTQPIGIIGNVSAPGNVNASNVSMSILRAGNVVALGQVNVLGNVITDGFFLGSGSRLTDVPAIVSGTQAMNISGNVVASGNVDASNVSTSILRAPNVFVTGQVNSIGGNVSSLGFFIGSGTQLTSVTATLGGTQSLDIIGNVVASGNVDASNVSTRLLRVVGNVDARGQVNVAGNVVALNFFGSGSGLTGVSAVASGNQNINIVGNVVASANVDASNVTANILRVLGNIVVGGQVNVIGNVTSNRLIGNGSLLQGIIATGNLNVDISGNVTASGNVNTQNVVTLSLQTSNCVVSGQTNVTGNIVAGSFVGDGSLLQGIILGAGGSPLPSFVPPSTGFTTTVPNTLSYSNVSGWTISLQQYQVTPITITTYNMPVNPDAPFVNLPETVTQIMTTPFSFSNGVWTGVCTLFTTSLFDSRPVSMGYNSGYGTLAGNSSATEGVGIQMVSVNGLYSVTTSLNTTNGIVSDVWPNPTTGSLWAMILPTIAGGLTILGQNFPSGQLYFVEFTKNMNYIISWHQITQNTNMAFSTVSFQSSLSHFISETEVYIALQTETPTNINPIIYDRTCILTAGSFRSILYARVNPTARTCQWITTVYSPNTGDYSGVGVSRNPQGTMLHGMGTIRTAGPGSMIVANTTGSAMASVLFSVSTIWRTYGFGLFPGNGVFTNNTLYAVYATSLDSGESYQPSQNSDRWTADGQVMYINYAYGGSSTIAMNTWVPGNTWTQRATLSPQKTDAFTQGGAQPMIFRIPIGNINSAWTAVAITRSPFSTGDGNPRMARIGSVTPANNGNVFLTGTTIATNTAAISYTLGSTTLSVPSGLNPSPPIVFRFQDTNGTFSNYSSIIGTTTDTSFRQYGTTANFNICTTVKVPGNNTSVRTIGCANFTNLTLNGTAATGLLANGDVYALSYDINSSMTVSNFRGQAPGPGGIAAVPPTSATIHFGPASDNVYNVVGLGFCGAAKVANV